MSLERIKKKSTKKQFSVDPEATQTGKFSPKHHCKSDAISFPTAMAQGFAVLPVFCVLQTSTYAIRATHSRNLRGVTTLPEDNQTFEPTSDQATQAWCRRSDSTVPGYGFLILRP